MAILCNINFLDLMPGFGIFPFRHALFAQIPNFAKISPIYLVVSPISPHLLIFWANNAKA